jgi:hypothetical protein
MHIHVGKKCRSAAVNVVRGTLHINVMALLAPRVIGYETSRCRDEMFVLIQEVAGFIQDGRVDRQGIQPSLQLFVVF